jgi:hypothetical protein
MSALKQSNTGEERTVRSLTAGNFPRVPPAAKAASSVFAAADAAKPPRTKLDVNALEIKTNVPLPPNSRSGPSKYAALLARMPKGSMVELPDKQAGSLLSQAKKSGVRCAMRKLSPTTRGVWRLE